jgi:hypothetical protein
MPSFSAVTPVMLTDSATVWRPRSTSYQVAPAPQFANR